MSGRQLGLDDVAEGLRLLEAAPPITQELPALVALFILSHLQLALRHPHVPGDRSSTVVRAAAIQLGDAIVARVPQLRDLVEQGWHPEYDVPTADRSGGAVG